MLVTLFIALHFIFDWILQPRSIAQTKKKSGDSLAFHINVNILPLFFILSVILICFTTKDHIGILWFFLINTITHIFIDAYLPSGKNERQMINWTAIDQILHLGIMIMSLELLNLN